MSKKKKAANKNLTLAMNVSAIAVGMLCMAYAAVPLYSLFCQVTGFGGTTQVAEKLPETILNKTVTVRFNSDTARDLPWDFAPDQNQVDVKIGENKLVFYSATNKSNKPIKATSVFNVTPERVGSYFNKVECFCFTEQLLNPGEKATFPVSFFIDPEITEDEHAKDINTITLSYTFFKIKDS